MKKLLLAGTMLFFSAGLYAQQADSLKSVIQKNAEAIGQGGKNELKINLLFSIAGMPEISYERILADNMGLGISAFVNIETDNDYKYGFIPHWRLYFGQKKAGGFFIEGNAVFVGVKENRYDVYPAIYPPYTNPQPPLHTYAKFGLGAAVGAKFLTRNGFLGELYTGVGRLFGNNSRTTVEAYPRVGITLGKRF